MLVILLALLWGMEIGFKFASRTVIYLLNPCHVTTLIQVWIIHLIKCKLLILIKQFLAQFNQKKNLIWCKNVTHPWNCYKLYIYIYSCSITWQNAIAQVFKSLVCVSIYKKNSWCHLYEFPYNISVVILLK